MENYTEGELKMINMVVNSDYSDGTLNCTVWSPAESPKEKGWLSSCVKKGLIICDNETRGEETVILSAKGIELYKHLNKQL